MSEKSYTKTFSGSLLNYFARDYVLSVSRLQNAHTKTHTNTYEMWLKRKKKFTSYTVIYTEAESVYMKRSFACFIS